MRGLTRVRQPSGFRSISTAPSIRTLSAQRRLARCPPSNTPSVVCRTQKSHCAPYRSISTTRSLSAGSSLPTSLGGKAAESAAADESALVPEEEAWEDQSVTIAGDRYGPFVVPPMRTNAERPTEISDASYTPATSMDDLDMVGGLRKWWDQQGHWPEGGAYQGFQASAKLDQAYLELVARRAITEAVAVRQAGREDLLTSSWTVGDEAAARLPLWLEVEVSGDGSATIKGNADAVIQSLEAAETFEEIPAEGEESNTWSSILADEEWTSRVSQNESWKNVSLADPKLKFAVTKRIFQLSKHRIPDSKLGEITSAQTLLNLIQKPPKPTTLSEEIVERRQDLLQTPNVAFSAKRVTKGDKERAVGRWKLIVEEWQKRDLPLDGTKGTRRSKEKAWLRGKL